MGGNLTTTEMMETIISSLFMMPGGKIPNLTIVFLFGFAEAGAFPGSARAICNRLPFASANAFPYLERVIGSACAYLGVAAAMNLVGAICWFQMRSMNQAVSLASGHLHQSLEARQ